MSAFWLHKTYCCFQVVTLFGKKKNKKKTLENTEGAIKNGKSRETGNVGYTRRRKTK